jgi:hypothetical protein
MPKKTPVLPDEQRQIEYVGRVTLGCGKSPRRPPFLQEEKPKGIK